MNSSTHSTKNVFSLLTPEQKSKIEEILSSINSKMAELGEKYGPKKLNHFRRDFFNKRYSVIESKIGKVSFSKLKRIEKDVWDIKNQHLDWLQNRTIESAILENYNGLICSIMRKWKRNPTFRSYLYQGTEYQDAFQELSLALIESIFSYTGLLKSNKKVTMTTYFYVNLNRRMSNYFMEKSWFNPIRNNDKKIFFAYKRAEVRLLTKKGSATHEEICKAIKVKPEDAYFVNKTCDAITDISSSNEDAAPVDYTEQFVPLNSLNTHNFSETNEEDVHSVKVLLENIGLNSLEVKIIQFGLANNFIHGWKTEAANHFKNPMTNKPYSKMRIGQIVDSAFDKIKSSKLNRNKRRKSKV